jgi:hypothetical protein
MGEIGVVIVRRDEIQGDQRQPRHDDVAGVRWVSFAGTAGPAAISMTPTISIKWRVLSGTRWISIHSTRDQDRLTLQPLLRFRSHD